MCRGRSLAAVLSAVIVALAASWKGDDPPVDLSVTPSGAFELVRKQDARGPGQRGQHAAVLAVELDSQTPSTVSTTTRDTTLVVQGNVDVAAPVQSLSEELKLEADTEECLFDTPVSDCWQRFGSYGIRRLISQGWAEIDQLNLARPDWMAHPAVQKRRLFELTLPGTHHSGAFQVEGTNTTFGPGPFGVITQYLNITQQLLLGIRAFDLRLAWNVAADGLYVSHGLLTVPFKPVLREMRRFLDDHPGEIIVLNARKDVRTVDAAHLRPLLDEESDEHRIPGQTVHEAVVDALETLVATFGALSRLPADESRADPTVGGLVAAGARALYFWEGQQVLCLSLAACQVTPGWQRAPPGVGLPFGSPMLPGERAKLAAGNRSIEPGCVLMTDAINVESLPDQAVRTAKKAAQQLRAYATEHPPACYKPSGPAPEIHTPGLLYSLDAVSTPLEQERAKQMQLLRSAKAIFSRGEGFTLAGNAEHTNYLLLVWLLKQGLRSVFMQPNILATDFVVPILVHRIVEAMQEQPECGFAVYCRVTGSCVAASLLRSDGSCRAEAEVSAELWRLAEWSPTWRLLCAAALPLGVALLLLLLAVWVHRRRATDQQVAKTSKLDAPEFNTDGKSNSSAPAAVAVAGASSVVPNQAIATAATSY